jgi:hypothetical protein
MPVIPALSRLRQEDCEFEGGLGYIVSSRLAYVICLNKQKSKQTNKNRLKLLPEVTFSLKQFPLVSVVRQVC